VSSELPDSRGSREISKKRASKRPQGVSSSMPGSKRSRITRSKIQKKVTWLKEEQNEE